MATTTTVALATDYRDWCKTEVFKYQAWAQFGNILNPIEHEKPLAWLRRLALESDTPASAPHGAMRPEPAAPSRPSSKAGAHQPIDVPTHFIRLETERSADPKGGQITLLPQLVHLGGAHTQPRRDHPGAQ